MAMIIAMLMMPQSSAPVGRPVAAEAARADPQTPARPDTCRSRSDEDGEIIVCGRTNNGRYRLRPPTTQYDKPKALGIGFDQGNGARGNAFTTQTVSPDRKPDKRIMVTLTVPF